MMATLGLAAFFWGVSPLAGGPAGDGAETEPEVLKRHRP